MRAPSDEQLLSSGDPEDFGVFYDRHLPAVVAYLGRRTRRAELTLDLVAETFARALEHRRRFDPARGPAIAWLLSIARNLLIDAVRRGRVADAARQRLALEPVTVDDEGLARVDEMSEFDLPSALACLSDAERESVLARVVTEEPYALIAERIGISEQVVRKRVSRGLAVLRRRFQEPS
jgi:RNA polymerase sigma factor (sigma-70 family)